MIVVVQQIFLFYFWFSYCSVPSSKQKVLYHLNSGNDMIRAMLIRTKYFAVFSLKGVNISHYITDIVYTESLSNIFLLDKDFLSIFLVFMLSHSIFTLSFYSYLWNFWSKTLSRSWNLLNTWEEVTVWKNACLNEWMASDFKSDLK